MKKQILSVALIFCICAPAKAAGWRVVGRLALARQLFTATLLHDGRVLVAGGYNDVAGGALASAEIFDPATEFWTSTGSMSSGRYLHTATLLSDGSVLVVCGASNLSQVSTAERYDPTSGTWSAAASPALARYYHTATILQNGSVLIAGGMRISPPSSSNISSAEIFDPTGNTWSPTGSLVTGRSVHTSTLLLDGSVLVVGGYTGISGAATLASVERYAPTTGMWLAAASMTGARWWHSSTSLVDGSTLVVGGSGDQQLLDSTERYLPDTNVWSSAGNAYPPRLYHTSTLTSNGMVVVAGGENSANLSIRDTTIYDSIKSVWSVGPPLKHARAMHSATALANGLILLAGGVSEGNQIADAEIFDNDIIFSDGFE